MATAAEVCSLENYLVLPDHISARRTIRAAVRLRNLKHWVPSFSIHLAAASDTGFASMLYLGSNRQCFLNGS